MKYKDDNLNTTTELTREMYSLYGLGTELQKDYQDTIAPLFEKDNLEYMVNEIGRNKIAYKIATTKKHNAEFVKKLKKIFCGTK